MTTLSVGELRLVLNDSILDRCTIQFPVPLQRGLKLGRRPLPKDVQWKEAVELLWPIVERQQIGGEPGIGEDDLRRIRRLLPEVARELESGIESGEPYFIVVFLVGVIVGMIIADIF